jgi:hypothetical protein
MSANTFDALNARATVIGMAMGARAVHENNVEVLRKMRESADKLYDIVIALAEGKADYPEWYAAFIDLNVNNAFHEMDETGEFTRIVDELKTIDATGYYFSTIVPLIKAGPAVLIDERRRMMLGFDMVIEQVIANRRALIKPVE